MKIYGDEKKEIVYKFKRKVAGIQCDCCKKVIPAGKWNNEEPSKYFTVRTSHNLWGNDSWESAQHYDICPACIGKFMTDYVNKAQDTYDIDVECTYCMSREEWVNK